VTDIVASTGWLSASLRSGAECIDGNAAANTGSPTTQPEERESVATRASRMASFVTLSALVDIPDSLSATEPLYAAVEVVAVVG
jgi:hypothetical protein